MDPRKKAIYILCLGELIERLSYFGLLTVLVLKAKLYFHLSDSLSFSIFGLFAALSYALLMLGGYLADKWLGAWPSLVFGGGLLILGNILLCATPLTLFYAGLGLVVVGTGLFKVNCTSLIGVLCDNRDDAREWAFTLFYSCMNIGGTLGPLLYGVLVVWLGWSSCFLLSAGFMLLALLLFICSPALTQLQSKVVSYIIPGWVVVVTYSLTLLAFLLLKFANVVIIAVFMAALGLLLKVGWQKAIDKAKLYGLLLLNLGSAVFFAFSLQVAGSVTLFVERDIHRVLWGITVPTAAFSSLDPLFVVLMAPVFMCLWRALAKRQCEPCVTTKLALGIGLAALAFLALALSALQSGQGAHGLAIASLIFAYWCLGSGEICLMPAVLAFTSKYAPSSLKSTLTGTWFLFVGLGGYLAGELAKLTDYSSEKLQQPDSFHLYMHAFGIMAVVALVLSGVMFATKPLLKKLMSAHTY